MEVKNAQTPYVTFEDFKRQVLADYRLGRLSREMSILGRREVLGGKAKFGIFGDGKELPQLAMARVFREGDFRSGYYRDQTFAMAVGALTPESFFASLYADTDVHREPSSGGRQMNGHFATRSLNEDASWKDLTKIKNISSDISTTSGQFPRLLGLAQASNYYKNHTFSGSEKFSNQGREVAFGTVGDASCAEGVFWETINAACAMQAPMIVSIWDDAYGISVFSEEHRSKRDMTEMLSGFQRRDGEKQGCEIIKVRAWDYPALQDAYEKAEYYAREERTLVIIHVDEVTQPQGHSTSGSHERYKSKDRLIWEEEYDCLKQFKKWILGYEITEGEGGVLRLASEDELDIIEQEVKAEVKDAQKKAWKAYQETISEYRELAFSAVQKLTITSKKSAELNLEIEKFISLVSIAKKEIFHLLRSSLWITRGEDSLERRAVKNILNKLSSNERENYSSHLYSQSKWSAENISEIKPIYSENENFVDGRVIIRDNFDKLLEKYPEMLIFGEDCGKIGDVNQGLEGLQKKYGVDRVSDTGIREATIIGQGIGLAMRGLRPVAEIQYLDYILYCIMVMSDDLATLHYRTKGGQKAPVIIRTRGHRLEGIWHSGSPMAMLLNIIKGILILVPRDFTKAAGFYNTMMLSDDPCLIIEPLNGYRLKEKLPKNLGEFTLPVGKIEVTREGADVTVVTYGSTWRVVMNAALELEKLGISVEVIDVQSLIPFDISHDILESVKKTNRLVIVDEDVEGGATAYILQQVLEVQKAFRYLDSSPLSITSKNHRPAYASDGDYFSKPSVDDVVEKIYNVMSDANPKKYPSI